MTITSLRCAMIVIKMFTEELLTCSNSERGEDMRLEHEDMLYFEKIAATMRDSAEKEESQYD